MSVYLRNPDAAPDDDFEPGRLEHLVAGNTGRLLDPRRTPITVVEIRSRTACFVLRIDDFEDRGALWEEPYERVDRYQFRRRSALAAPSEVETYRSAIARLAQPLSIPCHREARVATDAAIDEASRIAGAWLETHGRFLREGRPLPVPATREGDPVLHRDLSDYLEHRELLDLEHDFARRFVSNPYSGELVKGHRIVIAEMGLAPFLGTLVRDPDLFDGRWSRERRAAHVTARLGFIRALFAQLDVARVRLHRGMSTDTPMEPREPQTFVSTSFSIDVARSHYDANPETATCTLASAMVPVERLFMTYHETAAMNEQFKEAEAVLLFEAVVLPF